MRIARLQPGTVSRSWMLPVGRWTGGLNTISWNFSHLIICSAGQQLETGHVAADLEEDHQVKLEDLEVKLTHPPLPLQLILYDAT